MALSCSLTAGLLPMLHLLVVLALETLLKYSLQIALECFKKRVMEANDVLITDTSLMSLSTSPTTSNSTPRTSLRDEKPFILAPVSFTAGSSIIPNRSLVFQSADTKLSVLGENVLENELQYVKLDDDVLLTRISTLN
ncbi:unnamed protein product [Peronospora belbahrii]|uniref:Uncharacterized protein n=1 Tax=Peronospora belbahrii TaxID=622444 RepID=A0ABN8D2V6_9STRA|nr:unnamed protein product [Peronospora belbahrii]